MASISWFIFIEPISAAKLEAERPASRTAVMMMLNSRSTAMPISSTANTSAPNWRSMLAPRRPTTAPMKKEVTATIGMASRPARSARLKQVAQRIRLGSSRHPHHNRQQVAEEGHGLEDFDDNMHQTAAEPLEQFVDRTSGTVRHRVGAQRVMDQFK